VDFAFAQLAGSRAGKNQTGGKIVANLRLVFFLQTFKSSLQSRLLSGPYANDGA